MFSRIKLYLARAKPATNTGSLRNHIIKTFIYPPPIKILSKLDESTKSLTQREDTSQKFCSLVKLKNKKSETFEKTD
jgi:hypothetical protein